MVGKHEEQSMFLIFIRVHSRYSRAKQLSRNNPAAGAALKAAVGEETFFRALQALPADVFADIGGRNERIVMAHFTVAFFAANRGFVDGFRVCRFDHTMRPRILY